MSRYYQMNFTLDTSTFIPEEFPKIREFLEAEWELDDAPALRPEDWGGRVFYSGRHSLYGGESEEEFAERITHGIWERLGHYVGLSVSAIYLEELPSNEYEQDEEDYQKWLEKQSVPTQITHELDQGTL